MTTTTDEAPLALENPCEAYSGTLKEIFNHILAADDAPLSARLFSAAAFAFEADSFIYPNSTDFSEVRLAEEIDRVADRTYERLWMNQIQGQQVDAEAAMSMVQSFLLGRLDYFDPEFRETIISAWSACAPESGDITDGAFLQVEKKDDFARVHCQDLAENYQQLRNRLYSNLGPQIESHLTGFATGFMAARSPENYRSLSSLVQDLVLHIMMHKFFLAGDQRLFDFSGEPEEAHDLISDILCRTQSALADQKPSMENLEEMVYDQGLQDLTHTGVLILF